MYRVDCAWYQTMVRKTVWIRRLPGLSSLWIGNRLFGHDQRVVLFDNHASGFSPCLGSLAWQGNLTSSKAPKNDLSGNTTCYHGSISYLVYILFSGIIPAGFQIKLLGMFLFCWVYCMFGVPPKNIKKIFHLITQDPLPTC